jgi:hypothetical protein
MCALGIEEWATGKQRAEDRGNMFDHRNMCLLVIDDTEDLELNTTG